MNEMQTLRVLSHGKVTDLENGFKLPQSAPFSVYVRPKTTAMAADIVISAKCICDTEVSELPVPLNDWTPAAIVELAPNTISLVDHDVYWGAGNIKI